MFFPICSSIHNRTGSGNSKFYFFFIGKFRIAISTIFITYIFEAIRLNFLRIAENDVILSAICFALRITIGIG